MGTGTPMVRPDRDEIEARLDRTADVWRTWSQGIFTFDRWNDELRVSARTLKLLTHHRTGSPITAATTSLPERIGGSRNFDYRYCWIRDASFTIDAFLSIGLVEEAHRAIVALLRMARPLRPAPGAVLQHRRRGADDDGELDLPGYRGSTPVHRRNGARQLQLGCWGDFYRGDVGSTWSRGTSSTPAPPS